MKWLLERIKDIGLTLIWVFTKMGPAVRGIVVVTVLTYLIQVSIDRRLVSLVMSWLEISGPMAQGVALRQKVPLTAALFALSAEGMRHDFWWQLLTYMFLHSSVLHLSLNLLMVAMFGTAIELDVGMRRMLRIYFVSGICGGLGWLLLGEMWQGNYCVGASAGAFGLIAAFCALYPRRLVALFGLFEMQARTLAILLGVMSLLNLLWGTRNVAYSAHLVGGGVGYVMGTGLLGRQGGRRRWMRFSLFRRRPKLTLLEGGAGPTPDSVRAKVDRAGLASLNCREREILRQEAARLTDSAPEV